MLTYSMLVTLWLAYIGFVGTTLWPLVVLIDLRNLHSTDVNQFTSTPHVWSDVQVEHHNAKQGLSV
jgi:hypothetical protein